MSRTVTWGCGWKGAGGEGRVGHVTGELMMEAIVWRKMVGMGSSGQVET